MANTPEDNLIKGHLVVSGAIEKIFSALEERGAMLTAADKWKTDVDVRAVDTANKENKEGIKNDKGETVYPPDWKNSDTIRKNTLKKRAEEAIAQENGYSAWQNEDNPFTYEGDFKVFMNLITRHSVDGRADDTKKIEFKDYITTLKSDCAVALKKVAKKKRYYKTATFSPLYIDEEAYIVAYSHAIVKQVKKAYQTRNADGKLVYTNDKAKHLNFPKPIKPKPAPKPKEYKGLDGFNKSKEQLQMEFNAFLEMDAHELPM